MLCSNINTMLVQKSNSISTIVPFSSSAINNLWHAGQELNGTSIAGVSTGNRDMLCLLLCCHMETRKLWYALYLQIEPPTAAVPRPNQ